MGGSSSGSVGEPELFVEITFFGSSLCYVIGSIINIILWKQEHGHKKGGHEESDEYGDHHEEKKGSKGKMAENLITAMIEKGKN